MIGHLAQFVLPAAYALLPPEMHSPAASAMLLSIALQESGGTSRRQLAGPARSFWMFERAGIRGLLTHARSQTHLLAAARTLRYTPTLDRLYAVIEHNDTLAAVCARLLLWTLPVALPNRDEQALGWGQYIGSWRPGRPRPETWNDNFHAAWNLVDPRPPSPEIPT